MQYVLLTIQVFNLKTATILRLIPKPMNEGNFIMYVIEYTFKPIFLYVLMVAIMNTSILQWTIMMKKSLIDSLTFMSINVICNNKSKVTYSNHQECEYVKHISLH